MKRSMSPGTNQPRSKHLRPGHDGLAGSPSHLSIDRFHRSALNLSRFDINDLLFWRDQMEDFFCLRELGPDEFMEQIRYAKTWRSSIFPPLPWDAPTDMIALSVTKPGVLHSIGRGSPRHHPRPSHSRLTFAPFRYPTYSARPQIPLIQRI